ncbi:MAG: serine/threonine protein kinase [Anaerolineae bacterium]|nr:MAG: serine/threonine protein kinase [Anaerolineae bacterium]
MPSRIGALAGRYILTRLLGEDATGATFEGLGSAQDQPVLVKLLPKVLTSDPTRQEQLQRLVERLMALEHPNLLSVLEAGIQEGTPYLIAKGIAATPLAEKMGQALDVEQVASIITQVGEALSHAYQQGLTHGHLSPQNVLLAAGGQVLLSDLGLESVLETPWEKVQKELTAYLAPERLQGWLPDAQADVYALGVMLFEMLTGLRLDGPPSQALPWLRELAPDLASELEPVLSRALAADPMARYATVGEFMAALRPVMARYLEPKEGPQPSVPGPSEAPERLPVPPSTLIAPALEGIPAIPMPEPPPVPAFDWEVFSQILFHLPLPVPPPTPEPPPLPRITAEGVEFPTVSPIVLKGVEAPVRDELSVRPPEAEAVTTLPRTPGPSPLETAAPIEPPARPARRARQPAAVIARSSDLPSPPVQPVVRPQPRAGAPLRVGRLGRAILILIVVLALLALSCCAWLLLSAGVGDTDSPPASHRTPANILGGETQPTLRQDCLHLPLAAVLMLVRDRVPGSLVEDLTPREKAFLRRSFGS